MQYYAFKNMESRISS